MSEEMAVTDKSGDDAKINEAEGAEPSAGVEEVVPEVPTQPLAEQAGETPLEAAGPESETDQAPAPLSLQDADPEEESIRRKRRASSAFSNPEENEEFRGFDQSNLDDSTVEYNRILERTEAHEAEISAASATLTPVRNIVSTPIAASRIHKRLRKDTGTDGSRPSSALSSRSDGDLVLSSTDVPSSAASSPANRGRRATVEISSPLLRIPLEQGWRRELVYRAALDPHSRRNADIYYYTPQGKKLRSTREVGEHLCGTGLTLENFSFFKEPLGMDDPEKEIIRDAKLLKNRVESPVAAQAQAVEGKRAPKPKPPKGASPEPSPAKSPPAKIKVKSVGSRLSGGGAPAPAPAHKKKPSDNNNSQAWKKPKQVAPPAPGPSGAAPHHPPADHTMQDLTPMPTIPDAIPPPSISPPSISPPYQSPPSIFPSQTHIQSPPVLTSPTPVLTSPPPNLTSSASVLTSPTPVLTSPPPVKFPSPINSPSPELSHSPMTSPLNTPPPIPPQTPTEPETPPRRRLLPPCSMSCGGGRVPTLACASCLCLYHAPCAGVFGTPPATFLCLNCRTSPPPSLASPPPLAHKSGVLMPGTGGVAAPLPRAPPPPEKRVLLRMKVSGGTAGGEKVWAVAPPPAVAARATLPQSLAVLNGKRFIVVPRNLLQAPHYDPKKGRISNGSTLVPGSPRRRGRPRLPVDDTDYFTDFCEKTKGMKHDAVTQIFQYVGMRELAGCARVCRAWRDIVAAPALWRHVRMKNSHVNDWAGLCAALQRHGTKRLDLRKMLLPQNDVAFWESFAKHIASVDSLERIEMCRCPASAVEAVCRGLPNLRSLSALAVKDARLDPAPLASLTHLHELRLKSMTGLSLSRDLTSLAALTQLQHLSLTSIKELGCCSCEIVGSLKNLISLELGECTFRASFGAALRPLRRLQRLRLERGTAECAAPALLRALATLPALTQLELVNFDVKVGFDDALAECRNVQRLLIIPTYVSQSATTNRQVLSGVLRLRDSLTHLMWGVTIELLRVTELFIDQCDQGNESKKKEIGECIPVLKPVPGCRLPDTRTPAAGPPQVEILPLPTLQRLLSAQLPTTKLKLLRIPFHATWRQSLADFQ